MSLLIIQSCDKGINIILIWISEHCGNIIEGNDKADQVALKLINSVFQITTCMDIKNQIQDIIKYNTMVFFSVVLWGVGLIFPVRQFLNQI